MSGTAPDGGLYVPESLPGFSLSDFDSIDMAADDAFSGTGERFLQPFFAGSSLARELGPICRDALNFPLPLPSWR